MLVLSRRNSEAIVISLEDGREIVVTVAEIRRGKVRIGVAAPLTVKVHRAEVASALKAAANGWAVEP